MASQSADRWLHLSPGTRLDLHSRAPRLDSLRCRYVGWWDGDTIPSGVEPVGFTGITPRDRSAINDYDVPYGELITTSHPQVSPALASAAYGLRAALTQVIHTDLGRGDVTATSIRMRTFAGLYDPERDGQVWHSDDQLPPQLRLRYTVSEGVGPLIGLGGDMSRADIFQDGPERGTFQGHVPIGPGQRLEPQFFEPGTVLRHDVDGHGSPHTSGGRLVVMATVWVAPEL